MALLEHKIALITGGGAGFGRAMVTRFAREGARVLVAEYDAAHCEALRADYDGNDRVQVVPTDVREKDQVLAAVGAAVEIFGGLDILVNNAITLSPRLPLEQKTDEILDGSLHAGLWAAWWAMQAARPHLAARGGGSIINFSSIDVDTGAWLNADYIVTKSAIMGLTRNAAHEWGRFGIRVNAIAPTGMGTQFMKYVDEVPGFAERSAALKPLGRNGDPEQDIAPVAVFLASEMSRYITGELIHVDGGLHLPGYQSRPPDLTAYTS
ncbi:SDR family NAD(P)-dependent oxidoreductase [Nocardia jinanensis]|uniref:Short-chain dehydrogenase n=1 Tax=Nocardia jinanensis TaxID=382504 RepID=A0A917RW52_9NOCA|nr:SDR family oxidoreductase [Nocardia jinanensis]GGL41715.1 short-chain dehydrogenase [Nocardia jinanensis]